MLSDIILGETRPVSEEIVKILPLVVDGIWRHVPVPGLAEVLHQCLGQAHSVFNMCKCKFSLEILVNGNFCQLPLLKTFCLFSMVCWSQEWKPHWPPEPGYEGVHPLGSRSKTWGARLCAHTPFREMVTGRGQRENMDRVTIGLSWLWGSLQLPQDLLNYNPDPLAVASNTCK